MKEVFASRSKRRESVSLEERVRPWSLPFLIYTNVDGRQPYDQRNETPKRCWHDSWSSRWYSQERKDETRRQNWSDASQRCLVSNTDPQNCTPTLSNFPRIPFERALDFANKEKITEQLYPLFVHDIGALLYHPSNQPRPGVGGALAAVDRRRDSRFLGGPQTSQPPPLHHHHSMSTPIPHASQSQQSIAPHPGTGRPEINRAHTFPTPPTSASSIITMDTQGTSYGWSGAAVSG